MKLIKAAGNEGTLFKIRKLMIHSATNGGGHQGE